MIKIGITGSLASGKSTATKYLKKSYSIFNADLVVKNLYKKKFYLKKLQNKFNINKSRNIKNYIKQIILDNNKNLKLLEKITHPLVRREMQNFIKKNKGKKIIIFEIPLLVESGLMKFFDVIIFISSNKKKRLSRYLKNGGKKSIFLTLDNRQIKEDIKKKYCDHTIVNNYSFALLNKKILNIIRKYERNSSRY